MPKKAVFFLLFLLVLASLATLIYHKYGKTDSQESKLLSMEIDLGNLLANKHHCIIGAGLNLKLKILDKANYYQVESLEGIPKDLEGQLHVGDVIVAEKLSYSGDLIGSSQDLVVLRPSTGLVRTLPFIVRPFISCF